MASWKKILHNGSASADFPTLNQSTTGSAATLTTGRNFSIGGDLTASAVSFNGSGNVALSATINNGAVDANALGSNAVTNAKVANDAIDAAELATGNEVSSSTDGYFLSWDDTAGEMRWTSAASGDITSVAISTGTGLTGGSTSNSGAASFSLGIDFAGVVDGGVKPATGDQIHSFVTGFGYTTNTGTVTSVATGTGISGGTITGSGTIALALSELSVETSFTAGSDSIPFHDDGAGADRLAESGTIPISFFNNDASFTGNLGDITAVTVTAGAGLTGGGTASSGAYSKTLAVGAGTGVTVNANDIAIGQAVGTSDDVTFNNMTVSGNLIVSGSSTTVNTETVTIQDNIIVLNSNAASTPSEDAGIEVERGSRTNTFIKWDESAKEWVGRVQASSANDTTGYEGRIATIERASSGTSGSVATVGAMFVNSSSGSIYMYT